jgi:ring-1,2-phenylacetyl-CoA epoxidase subunit PaaE
VWHQLVVVDYLLRNFSLESREVDAGFVLTCQAQPRSNRVVLDYDQI